RVATVRVWSSCMNHTWVRPRRSPLVDALRPTPTTRVAENRICWGSPFCVAGSLAYSATTLAVASSSDMAKQAVLEPQAVRTKAAADRTTALRMPHYLPSPSRGEGRG